MILILGIVIGAIAAIVIGACLAIKAWFGPGGPDI
jgi:hypothetical protein